MKKVLTAGMKIGTGVLVAAAVGMMIFTLFTVTAVNGNGHSLLGYRFYIVQTDSMSRSEQNADSQIYFDAGDLVAVKKVKDTAALQPGDVISFLSTNEVSYGETVTHKIRRIEKREDGRVLGYVTYGTHTNIDDAALVTPENVLGVYAFRLPKGGLFFGFLKSAPGYILCILVPFLLLIAYHGAKVIRLLRQHRREQLAVLQGEKAQLEAEIQRLKAQTAAGMEQEPEQPLG